VTTLVANTSSVTATISHNVSYTDEGFTSKEPNTESLARMMEQEIAQVVCDWRAAVLCVCPAASTKPNGVAEMEHDLAEYLQKCEGKG
jgi:hypothetical protein